MKGSFFKDRLLKISQDRADVPRVEIITKLDFQVENQPRAVYIGRTALVPIYQYPIQKMSELKIFFAGEGGYW